MRPATSRFRGNKTVRRATLSAVAGASATPAVAMSGQKTPTKAHRLNVASHGPMAAMSVALTATAALTKMRARKHRVTKRCAPLQRRQTPV